MTQMTYTETLTVVHCTCGIAFAIPDALNEQALKSHTVSVWCPRGHKWHYSDSLERKLQREKERNARLVAERDQIDASLRAQKAATTRVKNKLKRTEHGVCPHCNRSFQNLMRHVKTKHPECVA